jgi:hypothetical protein
MKGWEILAALVLMLAACHDKAEPFYDRGLAAEQSGDWAGAVASYGQAIDADPKSSLGKKAAERLKAVQPKLDEQRRQDEARRQADEAKAAEEARQREEAACKSKKWVTYCKVGEMVAYETKPKCQKFVDDFKGIGVDCAPCKCAVGSPEEDVPVK